MIFQNFYLVIIQMISSGKTFSINQTKAESEDAHQIQIPILDMLDPSLGVKLVQSFKEIGFVIIDNHGISQKIIDTAFSSAHQVFQMKSEVKRSFGLKSKNTRNRGYAGPGQEVLDEKNKNNQKKQTFDLGHPQGPDQIKYYPPNDKFINSSKLIYDKLFEVYEKMMTEMEKGLNLQQGSITKKCCKDFYEQTLRYLYYPEVDYQQFLQKGPGRAGAHSDYGTVTLLLQKPGEGQNGLQALNSNKKWVKINPPDYHIVVNLGDLFQHWTNDELKSTIHKVEIDQQVKQKLKQGRIDRVPERQTIVLFCDPDQGQIFQCLKGFGNPKYQPINGKKYVEDRINITFGIQKVN